MGSSTPMARRAARKKATASDDDLLRPNEIATVIRALGKNPTQKEAAEMAKEAGGPVDLNGLTKFAQRKFPTASDQDRGMRAAFEALDKDGNGTIREAELRQILTTLGEALTIHEIDLIMREIETDAMGNVYYDAFVDKLVE